MRILKDGHQRSGNFMRTLFSLIFLLTASSILLPAGPLLKVSSSTLTPSTTFTLIFDKAVIEKEKVGSSSPNTLIKIEPDLAGNLTWISPNSARFERTGTPKIATTYHFSLGMGHKYLDGSSIPETRFRFLRTAAFQPLVNYWRGDLRHPVCFLRFNDVVDPSTVTSPIFFTDKGGQKVGATVRRGVYRDLGKSTAVGPDWKQYFESWEAPAPGGIDPETEISTSLTISPVQPLPAGEDWKLVLGAGVKNSSATAATTRLIARSIGTVKKFEVTSIRAITELDARPYLSISLSKKLPENITASDLIDFIAVEPAPDNMTLEVGRSVVSVRGDFPGNSKWKVTIKQGITAADGLIMAQPKSMVVQFRHLPPILAAPSYAAAQLATGNRTYSIRTVNIASARIRAKRLTGRDAVRTLQGYRHYSGNGPGNERIKQRHALPWSLVAGDTVYDSVIELQNAYDTAAAIEINWNDILGKDNAPGLLFLSIEADPKPGMVSSYQRKKSTQAYIQITDIGLAWKI
ncbi:MAG: hypothetical protein CMN02_00805, partial [Roseibacillus sp.]|nr:hypothetical protein [Roseibacillus sp.]